MWKFGRNHCRLNRIQTKVAPNKFVEVFRLRSMSAQDSYSLGAFGIIRHYHAAIACSSQVLRWEERETSVMTNGASTAAFVFGSDRLGRVFDHYQAMLSRQGHHRVHVGHLTVKMNRNDCSCTAGYFGCNFRTIQVVSGG